ncbi:FadR/GntR family transcriptional regulator [Arthrobacter sp. zg-Y820]|uniref:FadR/GntR family transcriptional regulator n=1 Tax=Arthrobacter sp. zg-Y820 TaxID=2894192 RepID=UPI001E5DC439|nr:FadR/GntR family transcriptional regulator [Arthrobacter sp. zg-Y820]
MPRFSAQARLAALQNDIMELILDSKLEAGSPLPTEAELCSALGVGRNTLRESLKVLQALGVVEIRHGYGMFVAPTNFDALTAGLSFRGRLSLRQQGKEALELVDVRQTLESGLIGQAMSLMTPAHLARIEETVREMESLADQGQALAAVDSEFHRQLFEPLDNELLTHLLSVFWDVYSRIHAEAGMKAGSLHATAQMHREIFEAVSAGDRTLASERINNHFDGIREAIHDMVSR